MDPLEASLSKTSGAALPSLTPEGWGDTFGLFSDRAGKPNIRIALFKLDVYILYVLKIV